MDWDAIPRNLELTGGPEHLEMAKLVSDTRGSLEAYFLRPARAAHPAEAIGGVNSASFDYRKPSIGRLRWRPI
jgi:hypothetical protein